jgi:DNA-binding PadR family transcriptional regulator
MTTAVFHILLSLVDETRHGYAIMREVETQSGGAVKLGPGTLYGALQRLLDDGWIEETGGPAAEDPGERRRYYRLTKEGRKHLQVESARLREWVRLAQAKKILPARG